jgi:hypothetical protein
MSHVLFHQLYESDNTSIESIYLAVVQTACSPYSCPGTYMSNDNVCLGISDIKRRNHQALEKRGRNHRFSGLMWRLEAGCRSAELIGLEKGNE